MKYQEKILRGKKKNPGTGQPPELLLLLGHRREPLGRVRGEQGEDEVVPRAEEEAHRGQQGDADQVQQAVNKPIRRGKHGGLREIERKILKENMN